MALGWTDLRSRRKIALRDGARFGLLIGLLYGSYFGFHAGLPTAIRAALLGIFGIGALVALIRLFTGEAVAETRAKPNQGTHRSIWMGIRVALTSGLVVGLSAGIRFGPLEGVGTGVGVAVFGGMFCGGAFAVKHFVLRSFLWLNRFAPLNYVGFLAEAEDLLLLNQVGGGYIFIHRLLREHLASLTQIKENPKPASRAAHC